MRRVEYEKALDIINNQQSFCDSSRCDSELMVILWIGAALSRLEPFFVLGVDEKCSRGRSSSCPPYDTSLNFLLVLPGQTMMESEFITMD